jgi:hypothetical protein
LQADAGKEKGKKRETINTQTAASCACVCVYLCAASCDAAVAGKERSCLSPAEREAEKTATRVTTAAVDCNMPAGEEAEQKKTAANFGPEYRQQHLQSGTRGLKHKAERSDDREMGERVNQQRKEGRAKRRGQRV